MSDTNSKQYRIYDHNKLHPHFKKLIITCLGILLLVSTIIVIALKGSLPSLIMLCTFLVIFLLNIKLYKNNKVIVFDENNLKIVWSLFNESIEKVIPREQIKKVQLASYQSGRYLKYFLEIYCIDNTVDIEIVMFEYMELEDYFESYCKKHNIDFIFD